MRPKLTTEEFINKSNAKHNFKYNYSKTNYEGSHEKVIIICDNHGKFEQIASDHLMGSGCPKCKSEKIGSIKRKNATTVIAEMNAIHNFRYDYSKIKYESSDKKVEIICTDHGIFLQTPAMHLQGQGCPMCGRELGDKNRTYTNDEFKTKAIVVHNNFYDYSKSMYIDYYTPITIICPKHGEFNQRPFNHLRGLGCKKCITIISKQETKWLDYLRIPEIYRQTYIKINNKKYYVDAFDPSTNTIYEFYGDFWHGNPKNPRFPSNKINKRVKKSFGELYYETIQKEQRLKNAGYKIISIWETDWKLLNQ